MGVVVSLERSSIGSLLGNRLRERADQIAAEWLARLLERLPERPNDIFPERNLLDHVPELVERIGTSLSSATAPEDVLSADVLHELRLLAQLRRAQGYDLRELLAELEVLGEVVAAHIIAAIQEIGGDMSAAEGVRVATRLQRVLFAMGIVGAETFLQEGARQRLRRAEILSAFARTVTHELRNRAQPALLGASLARSHLAKGRTRDADDALGRVEANLDRIDRIPGDLLAIAVGQEQKLAFPTRAESLDRVIRRSAESLVPYGAVHGVQVRVRGDLPQPKVDSGRVQLVLVNLLSNGIKFRDLDKAEHWVEIRATDQPEESSVLVEVEDNGVGIPVERLGTIFDDRLNAQRERSYESPGLGVALAHEVLLQLGSRLQAESEVGRGTRFTFRLPVER
jgi:signal transduction histidine kinase